MNIDKIPFQELILDQHLVMFSVLFFVVLLMLLNWKKLHRAWREWGTYRCLNRIGIKQRRNVICPDGLDGEFILDRLVMLPNALLLINFKRYSGNIYCAERISEWTQVVEQKSYKFENPLFDLNHQLTTLRQIVPESKIDGYLFFDHSAQFPKGHPDSILHPHNIPKEFLRENCAEPEPAVLKSWELLSELPVSNQGSRASGLKT
ncbi:MAG: NERD domain-containing protein [Gammaproteobacteria bacterium]|nr:NERD domain-containing protein [Gammaproteobacteria bacterium]